MTALVICSLLLAGVASSSAEDASSPPGPFTIQLHLIRIPGKAGLRLKALTVTALGGVFAFGGGQPSEVTVACSSCSGGSDAFRSVKTTHHQVTINEKLKVRVFGTTQLTVSNQRILPVEGFLAGRYRRFSVHPHRGVSSIITLKEEECSSRFLAVIPCPSGWLYELSNAAPR
jgi:hypothetical protein